MPTYHAFHPVRVEGRIKRCGAELLGLIRRGRRYAFRGRSMQNFDLAVVSSWTTESTMEVLIEEIMDLHASSPTFRQVFQSQQTTQIFVDAYKSFARDLEPVSDINQRTIRILEKLTHLGLALALDNAVAGAQKQEVVFVPPIFT